MIKKLSEAFGVSGYEKEVSDIIKAEISDYVTEIKEDSMGNIIASKFYGKEYSTVVLTANMDECGFIITDITENGYLKFNTIGKISAENLISKKVRVNNLIGIIALKAIHLTSKKEREVPVKCDDLFIDIGATSKAEAEEAVEIGDYAQFKSSFSDFGDNLIKGKALDSRTGCAILIDILKNENFNKINLICVFTVQKEISSRGALVAARSIGDVKKIITIDGVDAECGKGAVIGVTEDNKTFREIEDISKKYNIKYFTASALENTEVNAFSSQKFGVSCISLGIPCKYSKTPLTVMDKDDIKMVYDLICAVLTEENNA